MARYPKPGGDAVPNRMITVRMPAKLHERIREAAYKSRTSINAIAVTAIEAACVRLEATPTDKEPGHELEAAEGREAERQ